MAERRRARYFPSIAAQIPELRRSMLPLGLFLSRRTAAFDSAMVGVAAAVLMRWPLPLVTAAP